MVTGVWSKRMEESAAQRGESVSHGAMAIAMGTLTLFVLVPTAVIYATRNDLIHMGMKIVGAFGEESRRRRGLGATFHPRGNAFAWESYERPHTGKRTGHSQQQPRSDRRQQQQEQEQWQQWQRQQQRRPLAADALQDHRRVLGVSCSASASEIKRAYFAAAKRSHPDTNKGDPAAAAKFARVKAAFQALSGER